MINLKPTLVHLNKIVNEKIVEYNNLLKRVDFAVGCVVQNNPEALVFEYNAWWVKTPRIEFMLAEGYVVFCGEFIGGEISLLEEEIDSLDFEAVASRINLHKEKLAGPTRKVKALRQFLRACQDELKC